MISYKIAFTEEDYKQAASLFTDYAAWLNVDLSFQGFEKEIGSLKKMYCPPQGCIILCISKELFAGCVAIREIDTETAELKRMFVKPAFRGTGIGEKMLEKAIEFARNSNYKQIRLDTLDYMLPAINLYKKLGFYEIQPYYHNPNKTAIFFELNC